MAVSAVYSEGLTEFPPRPGTLTVDPAEAVFFAEGQERCGPDSYAERCSPHDAERQPRAHLLCSVGSRDEIIPSSAPLDQ